MMLKQTTSSLASKYLRMSTFDLEVVVLLEEVKLCEFEVIFLFLIVKVDVEVIVDEI